jgi:hypothetical protein
MRYQVALINKETLEVVRVIQEIAGRGQAFQRAQTISWAYNKDASAHIGVVDSETGETWVWTAAAIRKQVK